MSSIYKEAAAPQTCQVDPVIHQAIDAALEHLGRLDSETMTETEQALAAALRSVCIAVMHSAAGFKPLSERTPE